MAGWVVLIALITTVIWVLEIAMLVPVLVAVGWTVGVVAVACALHRRARTRAA